MAMAAMSIDFMLPAFPEIREEFGLADDSTAVSQLITAFFMGLAAGQLLYGPMSDRFGRKRLLYLGLGVYVVGAVGASLAPSLGATVACRAVWGFGAAAPRSLALAMVRDSFEGERMARTMSQIMTVFILVPVFAPGIGALFLTVAPWQVVFWIPVVAALCVSFWLLRLPETLPPTDRRSVSPAALLEALRVVVRTRTTMAYGIGVTMLFGVMTSFLGGSQLIFERVYDQEELFPVLFGGIACMLGIGSLLSGRLVMLLGLDRLIRYGVAYMVAAGVVLTVLVTATDGEPPLWAFCVALGLLLPGVTMLVPSANSAAMGPVPHVAGMASAVLGTISTGGGALLGSIVDGAFDDTVRPFTYGALGYVLLAAVAIVGVAQTGASTVPDGGAEGAAPEPLPDAVG